MDDITEKIKQATTIYFVCSGNIIRSSFAELYARHKGIKNVSSYGTTYHNTKIHNRSAQELLKLGIQEDMIQSFQPTHFETLNNFADTDLHLVMTEEHRKLLQSYGVGKTNIMKITELLDDSHDVDDPYFSNNYDEAYETIKQAVDQIFDFLS